MSIYNRVKDLMKLWVTKNGDVELTDRNSVLLGTIKYDYEGILDDYPLERLDRVEYRLPLFVLNRLNEEEKLLLYKEVSEGIKMEAERNKKFVEDTIEHLKNKCKEELKQC